MSNATLVLPVKPLVETVLQHGILMPFIAYSAFQLVAYVLLTTFVFPRTFASDKARSWLLSALVSVTSATLSVPFSVAMLRGVVTGTARTTDPASFALSDTPESQRLGGIFSAFLVMDLVVGTFSYPKQVQLVTGWVHHFVYLALMLDFMRHQICPAMCPMALMEIPTFLLAIGNINKRWRTEVPFAVSFFLTRIVFHLALVYSLYVAIPGYHFWIVLAAPFPMHVFWLRGWFVRRAKMYRKARLEAAAAAAAGSSSGSTAPSGVSTAARDAAGDLRQR